MQNLNPEFGVLKSEHMPVQKQLTECICVVQLPVCRQTQGTYDDPLALQFLFPFFHVAEAFLHEP